MRRKARRGYILGAGLQGGCERETARPEKGGVGSELAERLDRARAEAALPVLHAIAVVQRGRPLLACYYSR